MVETHCTMFTEIINSLACLIKDLVLVEFGRRKKLVCKTYYLFFHTHRQHVTM